MTLNRQDSLAAQVGAANRGREIAGPDSYLLAWTATLSFCGGLFGLAVSSTFEVAVPRWLILACGAGCALQALQALLLSRPWQQRPNRPRSPTGSVRVVGGAVHAVAAGAGVPGRPHSLGLLRHRSAPLIVPGLAEAEMARSLAFLDETLAAAQRGNPAGVC
jgi:hypothetical protein